MLDNLDDLYSVVLPNITYSPKIIFSNKVPALDANFFRKDSEYENKDKSTAYQLKNLIATWYVALRNIALVIMLLILVWIGIKITISSVSSDKAKYKQMLIDWIVAICLLMFLHYIMVFLVNIVELFDQMLVGTVQQDKLMNLVRFKSSGFSTISEKFYWTLIYTILVIYTLMFTWQYLKRVIRLAFLTLLAPIMAATYPIDKMTDGQAQGFNKWLKDYIYELLIQPLHLLLYTILISSVSSLAESNPIYVLVALGSFIPIEKMLREYLQFEKGHVKPPNPAGLMTAAALGQKAVDAILPSNLKQKSGKGGESAEDKSNEKPIGTRGDNAYDLLGGGGTQDGVQDDGNEQGNGILENRQNNEFEQGQNDEEKGLDKGFGNGPISDNQDDFDNLKRTQNGNEKGFGDGSISDNKDDWDILKGDLNETGKGYGKGKFSENQADYDALKAAQRATTASQKVRRTPVKRNIRKPSNFRRGLGAVGRKYGGKFVRRLTGGKKGIRGIAHALAGVARIGAGIAGAATLATAGVAMGVVMGDPTKAAQLGMAGLGVGYKTASGLAKGATGLIGKGADAVSGVASTYSSAANPEKYEEKLKQKEQEKIATSIRDNDSAMRMFRMKNKNMSDRQITNGINDCVAQGIDDPEDIQKVFDLEEKAGVDRNTAIGAMKISKNVDAKTLRNEQDQERFRKSIENNLQGRVANPEQKSHESIELLKMIHGVDRMSRIQNGAQTSTGTQSQTSTAGQSQTSGAANRRNTNTQAMSETAKRQKAAQEKEKQKRQKSRENARKQKERVEEQKRQQARQRQRAAQEYERQRRGPRTKM